MLQKLSFTIGNQTDGYRTVMVKAENAQTVRVHILRNGFQPPPPPKEFPTQSWLTHWHMFAMPPHSTIMKHCHKLSGLTWQLVYTAGEHTESLANQGSFPDTWNDFINWLAEVTPQLDWQAYRLPERKPGEFIVCGVTFHGEGQIYHYWTEDTSLSDGDWVRVPVGNGNQATMGRIESIGYFTRDNAPFPIERMKMILGRYEKP